MPFQRDESKVSLGPHWVLPNHDLIKSTAEISLVGKKRRRVGGVCMVPFEKLFSLMIVLVFMGVRKTQIDLYVVTRNLRR